MSVEVTVEKQTVSVRHVIRCGDETLWWGQVMGQTNAPSPNVNMLTTPPVHVFAKSKQHALEKLREKAAKEYHLILRETRVCVSIPGDFGPYEVEL